ncbi:hypothetical protein [Bradyrhizobium sp. McL0616]|uniref:hypothetical protein n=1 Tax=Bradyrhizobium sp. McL0616 TaxID=3415674 RepID=UPI003CF7A8F1
MYRDAIGDELRQIERDVVEGERRLAKQEALTIELKRQKQDISKAEVELERMRSDQRLAIRIGNACSRGSSLEKP